MAGATVQWLRDGLQMIQSAPEVESLAAQVDDTGDVYLVPAFAGLGTPDWDGYARGTLVGMTRGTDPRPHRARGAGSHRLASRPTCSPPWRAMPRIALTELRVDGGASRNNLLMQMQADFLGVPVVRPQSPKPRRWAPPTWPAWPPASGATPDEIAAPVAGRTAASSRACPRAERLAKLARWRDAVERAKGWARP